MCELQVLVYIPCTYHYHYHCIDENCMQGMNDWQRQDRARVPEIGDVRRNDRVMSSQRDLTPQFNERIDDAWTDIVQDCAALGPWRNGSISLEIPIISGIATSSPYNSSSISIVIISTNPADDLPPSETDASRLGTTHSHRPRDNNESTSP